jgi:hypothetical protein
MSELAHEGTALYRQFDDINGPGITDVPLLASYFYVLVHYREAKLIPQNFYETQLDLWCPRMRSAHSKLAASWSKPEFQAVYAQDKPFLKALDYLAKWSDKSDRVDRDCRR